MRMVRSLLVLVGTLAATGLSQTSATPVALADAASRTQTITWPDEATYTPLPVAAGDYVTVTVGSVPATCTYFVVAPLVVPSSGGAGYVLMDVLPGTLQSAVSPVSGGLRFGGASGGTGCSAQVTATVGSADTTPPTTTATPAHGAVPPGLPLVSVTATAIVKNAAGAGLGSVAVQCWDSRDVQVGLAATDSPGGTGVKTLTYSASGAQPIASTTVTGATARVDIAAAGLTTLSYQAADQAGNVEGAKHLSVLVGTGEDRLAYACAAPTPAFSLPPHGTLLVTGTVSVGGASAPFSQTVHF